MKITDGRKRGWWWARNEIFDQWGPVLKPNGLAVYLCLCRHVNNDAECWPSLQRIAQKCGMHRTTVIKNIKLLESYQLIRSEPRLSDSGDPDTNVYTILEVPKPPEFPNKKSGKKSTKKVKGVVAENDYRGSPERLGVVAENNHPSSPEQPPVVAENDYGGSPERPKGNTSKETQLKETHLRNITTTTTTELSTGEPSESSSQEDNKKPTTTSAVTVASKPDEDSGDLVFDFALKDFSPEQQRRAFHLLKDIPTVEGKQLVLDEFNSAYQQGTIKSPWRYLSTLVKKYQTGELTATSELPEQRAQIQKAKQRQQQIDACPYCNERGTLYFSSPQKSFTTPCSHDAKKIVDYAIEHDAEIVFAPPSHRYPSRPQRNKSLTPEEIKQTKAKLAALIGGFQNE